MSATAASVTRHDWALAEVKALFTQPFNDLLFQAQTVHRRRLPGRLQVLPAVRPLQHRSG